MRIPVILLAAVFLAACATPPRDDDVQVLLIGEQHDAASHQLLHAEVVQALADRRRLAALAIEMAETGADTRGLPPGAAEPEVRSRLRWSEAAWPWAPYAPAIMAAVRAGVPVVGANLPRQDMSAAMRDDSLDAAVPPAVLAAQREAIREGHCRLLPEARVPAMTRVQLARDRAMARVLAQAVTPGKTVVLLAGSGHADPALGVPLHLPAHVVAKPVLLPPQPSGKDPCEALRGRMPRP